MARRKAQTYGVREPCGSRRRAPNGQTIVAVVLGAASHPSRYNDMRAILAAMPHDFPELAEPAEQDAVLRPNA